MTLTGSVFSEENFRKMVENAPVGILIIDREMKWRFVNQRFCEITGYFQHVLQGLRKFAWKWHGSVYREKGCRKIEWGNRGDINGG